MKKMIEIEEGEQLFIIGGDILKYAEYQAYKLQRELDAIPISPILTYDFAVCGKIDIGTMRRVIARIKGRHNLIFWAWGQDVKAAPEIMASLGY